MMDDLPWAFLITVLSHTNSMTGHAIKANPIALIQIINILIINLTIIPIFCFYQVSQKDKGFTYWFYFCKKT